MSGKREEKNRKKRLKDSQDRAGKKTVGKAPQPEQLHLGHLAPDWRNFYLGVIEELEHQ